MLHISDQKQFFYEKINENNWSVLELQKYKSFYYDNGFSLYDIEKITEVVDSCKF